MTENRQLKKIAIFTISTHLSGAEKRFIRIASEICRQRTDIILIVNQKLFELAARDQEIKQRIIELDKSGSLRLIDDNKGTKKLTTIFLNFIQLYKILKADDIKVIHVSLGALKYGLIKKIMDLRVIAEITSPDVAEYISSKQVRRSLNSFDKIIAVSKGVKTRSIKSLEKVKRKNLIAKVECFGLPFFLPRKGTGRLDITDKENLVVYASRFIDRKNPVLFARVVSRFLAENRDWKAAILGKGPLEKDIKSVLKKYLETKRVTVEHTNDMYGYLKKSKIFVSLIYPDNYPSQSLLEAMYMKNAIIATDVGDTKKLVAKDNGFLVRDYQAENVLKALKEAISDQNRLKRMGEQSYKKIETQFSYKTYLQKLENMYNNLI